MLACKTPISLCKGFVLYSFEGISYDDGSSSVEAHEWHVRSIQSKPTYLSLCGTKIRSYRRKTTFVNLVSKRKGKTWVKGEWAKYIAKDYQNRFELGERLPEGIYTTPLQAIKFALKKQLEYIAIASSKLHNSTSKTEHEKWIVTVEDFNRELKLLKGRLTRIEKLK